MNPILTIVTNTPLWVFALFALLVVFGLQALRPRTLPIWRLLAIPLVFIAWGVISLIRPGVSPFLVLDWLAAAAVGGAIAWALAREGDIRIDRAGTIAVAGSALPLTRNMLIFSAKYAMNVAMAINPTRQADLAPWDAAVSGASAGYFLAWLAIFALAYRRALQSEPVAQIQ
jgi:hypothetical protein